MEREISLRVKIVLVGDGAVGKTSIAKRYLRKGYNETYVRTIGADFYSQQWEYDTEIGTANINWMIWDLGGQPSFNEVRTEYYYGAKGAVLIYDISRPETFYNLPKWINEFFEYANGMFPIILVGNKSDLRSETEDTVSKAMGRNYAKKLAEYTNYNVPYIESSAKEGKSIDKIFEHLALLLMEWAKRK